MLDFLSTIKPEILVAACTTIALLYHIYTERQKDKEWNKIIANHITDDIKSRETLSATLQKLIDVIKSLKKK